MDTNIVHRQRLPSRSAPAIDEIFRRICTSRGLARFSVCSLLGSLWSVAVLRLTFAPARRTGWTRLGPVCPTDPSAHRRRGNGSALHLSIVCLLPIVQLIIPLSFALTIRATDDDDALLIVMQTPRGGTGSPSPLRRLFWGLPAAAVGRLLSKSP